MVVRRTSYVTSDPVSVSQFIARESRDAASPRDATCHRDHIGVDNCNDLGEGNGEEEIITWRTRRLSSRSAVVCYPLGGGWGTWDDDGL